MEEYYLKQISTLNKTNEELTSKSEDRITQLTLEHEKILKKLRSDHENEIENIKNDHRIVIENIRSSKLLEFSVVQENGSYLNTLKNASKNLENASDNLQSLKVEMESNIERLLNDREIQLEAREKRLEGLFSIDSYKQTNYKETNSNNFCLLNLFRPKKSHGEDFRSS